jgi:hypothetical protein
MDQISRPNQTSQKGKKSIQVQERVSFLILSRFFGLDFFFLRGLDLVKLNRGSGVWEL